MNEVEQTTLQLSVRLLSQGAKSYLEGLGTALFVVSSTLILKFGIATAALAGSTLLIRGEIEYE